MLKCTWLAALGWLHPPSTAQTFDDGPEDGSPECPKWGSGQWVTAQEDTSHGGRVEREQEKHQHF